MSGTRTGWRLGRLLLNRRTTDAEGRLSHAVITLMILVAFYSVPFSCVKGLHATTMILCTEQRANSPVTSHRSRTLTLHLVIVLYSWTAPRIMRWRPSFAVWWVAHRARKGVFARCAKAAPT